MAGGHSNMLIAPILLPLKHQRLDVLYRVQQEHKKKKQVEERQAGLQAIEKLLKSKKTEFARGPNGLQAKRAHTILSFLTLLVKKGRLPVDASQQAAESHGFAHSWGGRQLHIWATNWISKQELPHSLAGCHAKVYSLFDDPTIAAELRTYVRSNKWSVNPEKLAAFSKNQLIPEEAKQYLRSMVNEEMPHGLKQYMELELFPCIHLKVG